MARQSLGDLLGNLEDKPAAVVVAAEAGDTESTPGLQEAEDEFALVTTHAVNFAHLYSLWAWLVRQEALPPVADFSASYAIFMDAVVAITAGEALPAGAAEVADAATSYADNARGATTDIKPRAARDAALTSALATLLS